MVAAVLVACAAAGGLTWEAADDAVPDDTDTSIEPLATPAGVNVGKRAAAIDKILKRRALGVLQHRRELFLADLDPRKKQLVGEQRTLYSNLAQFGFDRLFYRVVREQYDAALEQRHGASAYAVQVVMEYRIKGIDQTSVRTLLGYTFVQRGGRWLLTDDDDLDHGLPVGSHREAWDSGPVLVRRDDRALVVVERKETGLANDLLEDAGSAVRAVSKRWPRGWKGAGLVIALKDRRVRTADYTVTKNAEDAVAMATAVYRTLPGQVIAEGERGGSYVVINPRYRHKLSARVLAHEFTHVATAPYGSNAPRWLVEGMADYIEYLPMDGEPALDLVRYRTKVRNTYLKRSGGFPPDQEFYSSMVSSYALGWYAVDYLFDHHSKRAVANLYADLAENGFSQVQRDRILKDHVGLTEKGLFRTLKKGS